MKFGEGLMALIIVVFMIYCFGNTIVSWQSYMLTEVNWVCTKSQIVGKSPDRSEICLQYTHKGFEK